MISRPIFRWAGSKRKLIPKIKEFWSPAYSRYVEPFAGSACFLFHAQPKEAIINDINEELIATYKEIAINPSGISEYLSRFVNDREFYYVLRDNPEETTDKAYWAARFIYLNRYCFNGLYRTNLSGKFNVPYGGQKSGSLPSQSELKDYAQLLKRVQFCTLDFEELVKDQCKPGDFIYLDPPYFVHDQRVFREYGAKPFGLEDLHRLKGLLEHIHRIGANFLVSYHGNADTVSFFQDWRIEKTKTNRQIAGFSTARKMQTELLVSNIVK